MACACVKLANSGYGQASAGLLRGAVETIFLLDLFSSDADALERWRTAEPRDQEREYSPFDMRVALDGLRRHQLRSSPLKVSGKVFAEVLTMRWILTASVLAAAAIGMTIGVSIRSRRTDPGTVARASRRVFSRLDPHGRRPTTEFSNH